MVAQHSAQGYGGSDINLGELRGGHLAVGAHAEVHSA